MVILMTGDNTAAGYWSVIEIDVGVFCLYMPAMRSLLGRLFPQIFRSTKGTRISSSGQPLSHHKIRMANSGPNTSFVQLIELDHTGNVKSHGDA